MLTKDVAVILGTRPGIVKFAPVLHAMRAQSVPHFVIHSGQHYSREMDAIFFEQLRLPPPDFRVGEMRPDIPEGEQTAEMLAGIERVLVNQDPAVVLVGGDANTNLAGALAARKLHLVVGHVEAGLRSGDWRMSEEHNRVMIDHISDVLFAPSERARVVAENEGVRGRIVVSGSTIGEAVEATLSAGPPEERIAELVKHVGRFVLLTLHRQENVDDPATFRGIIDAVRKLPAELDVAVVWPVHPRARKRLIEWSLLDDLAQERGITLLKPVGHRELLFMLREASLAVTDSGGLQQEACILRVPSVTTRPTTEWVETVEVGANIVTGTDTENILEGCRVMLHRDRWWDDPFSPEGPLPSRRIIAATLEALSS